MSSITFEEAIELSSKLLNHIERGELETASAPEHIAEIVKDAPGARGFLVAYLTGDSRIAEEHPKFVLHGLAQSEDLITGLITKNIVMSSAMSVLHERNGNEQLLAESNKVARRSVCLAQSMASKHLLSHFRHMHAAIKEELKKKADGQGIEETEQAGNDQHNYSFFLKRWKYDREQLSAAENAVKSAIASIS
ncbi:MAG: hypothetical protein C5B53_11410 [Candidatus Melainabacteria bacterium]|nr:MAG: hypothetical protein C5B53_11410 [Candidatus Melainabacteria bacterium]